MTKRVQSLILLGALISVCFGISLSAQQATPSAQPTDPQAQQPTADQSAPPAAAQAPAAQTPQATPQQTPDQASQPAAGSQTSANQTSGVQAFSGTIVKSGDKYMLQDEASGQTYDIDHQDEVQKYEGKRVKVHGTLDSTGKMIHLQ